LFAPENQQLGIGREDLPQSVLKGAASFNAPADVVYPLHRNPFDTTLLLRHESEKPNRMTLARRTLGGSQKDRSAGVAGGEMLPERNRLFVGKRPHEIRLGDGFRVEGALVRICSHYLIVARGGGAGQGQLGPYP
jgi:hypothetical protein